MPCVNRWMSSMQSWTLSSEQGFDQSPLDWQAIWHCVQWLILVHCIFSLTNQVKSHEYRYCINRRAS